MFKVHVVYLLVKVNYFDFRDFSTSNGCLNGSLIEFDSLKEYDILIILVDLFVISSQFSCYSDPDPHFLKLIRIRPNEVVPDPDSQQCVKELLLIPCFLL